MYVLMGPELFDQRESMACPSQLAHQMHNTHIDAIQELNDACLPEVLTSPDLSLFML